MTGPSRDLSEVVGGEVASVAPLRWGFAHHTELVTLADGRRVVVKRFEGGDGGAEVRRAVALADRLPTAGIPTPAILSADPDGDPPIMVLSHIEGTNGAEWLDADARARHLAETMGALAIRFRHVRVEPGDADDASRGPWSDGARLADAATGWLERLRPRLDAETGGTRAAKPPKRISRVIDTLADIYNGVEPCLAHGDFVPVNVLLGPDGTLAGVLDLGAWRIAHPWLDVAWWGWVVRTFHPEAWTAAWPSMLASAGVPSGDASARTLHALEVVRCLEWAATGDDPMAPRVLAATVSRDIEA